MKFRFNHIAMIAITGLTFLACNSGDSNDIQKQAQKMPLVKVQPVVKTTMVSVMDITGTVQANKVSEVKSPVDGVVETLFARENENVEKDRIIAVVNPNDRVALIASNQVRIQELESKIKMAGLKTEAQQKLQEDLEKAANNLEYAKKMYQPVPVICPMNGMVTTRWLDQGSQVIAKEKILTISDMGSLVVKTEVNEHYFTTIKQGKKITVMLNAYPGDTLSGTISLVYPQIDPSTRSVKFDVKVQANDRKIFPGMMATLKIPVAARENTIAVNPDAVLTGPDNKNFLFVVDEDSVAHKRGVYTGISGKQKIEITEGLQENERVVVMGQEMLKDGMKVKITGRPKNVKK